MPETSARRPLLPFSRLAALLLATLCLGAANPGLADCGTAVVGPLQQVLELTSVHEAALAKATRAADQALKAARDAYAAGIEKAKRDFNAAVVAAAGITDTAKRTAKLTAAGKALDYDLKAANRYYNLQHSAALATEEAAIAAAQAAFSSGLAALDLAELRTAVETGSCPQVWIASSNVDAPKTSSNYATMCGPTPVGRWRIVQSAAGGVGSGVMVTSGSPASGITGRFEVSSPPPGGNDWSGDVVISRAWDKSTGTRGIMELHQTYLRVCKCTLAGCKPCDFPHGAKMVRWELIGTSVLCDPAAFNAGEGPPTVLD